VLSHDFVQTLLSGRGHQVKASKRPGPYRPRVARCAASVALIVLAGFAGGCASSGGIETSALATTPIADGKARVSIKRSSSVQAAGVPATITLNGQKVASIYNGGDVIFDVPAGDNTLAASAWSYPGEYKLKINAVSGQTYNVEVGPRADSLLPSMFGPIGGMIDAGANENAGAFEMRLAGAQSTAADN